MKSKVFVLPSLVLAATLGVQAQSQKIAVIAIQQAIVATKDGQKAAAELDSKAGPKKKELEQKQGDINSLQDQLSKGQNTLSEGTKTELYKNIESKKKSLQRDFEDAQAEMDQEQQKILQQLGQKMMAVIERYSKDNGYTLVVDVSNPQTPVLYASPTIDITKDIIELYDKSAAQMSSPKPAAPAAGAPATKPPAAAPAPPAPKPPAGTQPGTPANPTKKQ
ncbi:MAG TPA: OmpH family outer membrane protein [Bryobacteraceae bacterium]|nr:OmpH family outer membrane protein [Bryobacteraceae bacterium]